MSRYISVMVRDRA